MMSGCELSWNQLPIHSDYRRSDDRVTLDSDLVTLDGRCRAKTKFLVTKSGPQKGHGRTDGRDAHTSIFGGPVNNRPLRAIMPFE